MDVTPVAPTVATVMVSALVTLMRTMSFTAAVTLVCDAVSARPPAAMEKPHCTVTVDVAAYAGATKATADAATDSVAAAMARRRI